MANKFHQQHVLITGAARGIGYEIALQFAQQGAIISLVDYHAENLAMAVKALELLGNPVHSYAIDISNRSSVFEMVKQAEAIQPIDILINNAGIAAEKAFLNIEAEEWDQILAINITGMFHVSQAVCRYMATRKKGVVVNMASKNGLDGEFGYTHYNVSKGGVIMLTKTMALELAHLGIRVNAVCPGYIQTPMSMEIDPPEFTEKFVQQYIPLNRPGKVAEIAPIFLFLAGEESSFITGQVIIADGGQLAGQKPGMELLNKIQL